MLAAFDIPFIPNALQLRQIRCLLSGELAGLPKHGFSNLFAKYLDTTGIYVQRLEEDVLLGEHDAQEILQALPVMVGGVHVDMDAAGVVDLSAGMAHLPHTFLKFRQLIKSQLGGDHFHPVVPIPSPRIAVRCLSFPLDTGVAHQFPFFIFCVPDNPCAIGAAFVPGRSPEVICQSDGSLFSCDAGELHLHAEALIFQPDQVTSPSSCSARKKPRMLSSTSPACGFSVFSLVG